MVKVETPVESSPASTNLVSWVWVELEGGLSLSCPGVKCGRTEVHTPPETQEAGRPVELKEATTGMKQLHKGRGDLHTSLRSGPDRSGQASGSDGHGTAGGPGSQGTLCPAENV